ncbi:MAG: hypothetical protein R3C09_18005 [Pirellulaceae bacterium]|jgi:hypothetical protein
MAHFALVMGSDFTCNKLADGLYGAVAISAAVGDGVPARCPNIANDVRVIQAALNRFSPAAGGPTEKLEVDGACGPLTRGAILHFQNKWDLKPKGWSKPDGIVDREGATIQRLRKGAGANTNLPVEFATRIPDVLRVVTAAQAALMVASQHYTRPSGGLPSLAGLGAAAAQVMNRHFHADLNPTPAARISQIDQVFQKIKFAIGHIPIGAVLATEEPPIFEQGAFMFTFVGGFDRLRPTPTAATPTWRGLPVSSIYMCPKARTLSQDGFTYAMIHELAHYVSTEQEPIEDVAYFHKSPELYRKLSPFNAFRNADCFSQYAFEVVGKRDFNVGQNTTS